MLFSLQISALFRWGIAHQASSKTRPVICTTYMILLESAKIITINQRSILIEFRPHSVIKTAVRNVLCSGIVALYMVGLTKLSRILLAVLVIFGQSGLVHLCEGLCQISNPAVQSHKMQSTCCGPDCKMEKKQCGCAKVSSPDNSPVNISKIATPSFKTFIAVLSEPKVLEAVPSLNQAPVINVHNHDPPGNPPVLERQSRAPPVV
jgi:hypothetical protein